MNPQSTLIEEDQGSARDLSPSVSSPIVDGDLPDLDALEKVARAAEPLDGEYDESTPDELRALYAFHDTFAPAHVLKMISTIRDLDDAVGVQAAMLGICRENEAAWVAENAALTARVEALEGLLTRSATTFDALASGLDSLAEFPNTAANVRQIASEIRAALQGVG